MSRLDEATLLKMAEAELLGEARRAAVRHSTAGISGWQPCRKPNKFFLANTILQTVASNRILSKKQESKRINKSNPKKARKERKLLQVKQKNSNFVFKKPANEEKKKDYLDTSKTCNKYNSATSDKKDLKSSFSSNRKSNKISTTKR